MAAREKVAIARELLARDVDPSVARRSSKSADSVPLVGIVEQVGMDWFAAVHKHSVSESQYKRNLSRFRNYIVPFIGQKAMSDVTSSDILDCVQRIASRGTLETAHRTK